MAAILVGVAVMATLERGFSFQWYWALGLGTLAYLIVRYIGWGLGERREMKEMMDRALQESRERDKISN